MATPEQANAAMAIITKLQASYTSGDIGLPPGADWVDTAFAYLDHAGVYDDEAQVREILDGYGILAPPPPPPPSFQEAMDIPEWWAGFRAFTEGEYSSENPDFIDAVRFQTQEPRAIYDTFVTAGADRQVNISAGVRSAIDQAFAGDAAPGYDVFSAATAEIARMCSGDTWRRFLAAGQ